MISLTVIPSATMATTVATGIRIPRMHGWPPITSGSVVIRHKKPEDVRRYLAPRGVQRICWRLTMRLTMTWLTAHSVNAVEMASAARWRSP
jgi:hypothetical protein